MSVCDTSNKFSGANFLFMLSGANLLEDMGNNTFYFDSLFMIQDEHL